MKSPAYIHQRVLNRDEIAVVCRNVRQNSATHEAVIDEKKGNKNNGFKKRNMYYNISRK